MWCGSDCYQLIQDGLKHKMSGQEAPHSYQVHTEDGRVYCPNRSHLYKVPENFQAMPNKVIVESKVNIQALFPARKPTEETLNRAAKELQPFKGVDVLWDDCYQVIQDGLKHN